MPLPGLLTQLEYWSPSDAFNENDLLAQPPIPLQDTVPTRPWILLKFTKAIVSAAYASPSAWASYFLLTSLSHPASVNQTQFTDFTWSAEHALLAFRPINNLVPGDRYLASLLDNLRDTSGRQMDRTYTWTFTCANGQSGQTYAPEATPLYPQTETTHLSEPGLVWEIDPTYVVPTGYTLQFSVQVASDSQMTNVLWQDTVDSLASSAPPVIST